MPSAEMDYSRILKYEVEDPNPLDYEFLIVDSHTGGTKGAKVYLDGIVRYLKACRIVYKDNRFYQFDGCIYSRISDEQIKALVHRALDICTSAAGQLGIVLHASQLNDMISKLKAISTIDQIDWADYDLTPYKSEEYKGEMFNEAASRGEYDHIIPFNNGLYNIQTDELLPFTPGIFIDHKCRSNYDPTINTCPAAEEIFRTMIPDEPTRNCFFQMVGYTLYANRITGKDASIFIMYGQGANGKGTIQDMITMILGDDNVSTLDIAQVTAKFTSNLLDNALVNFCSDATDKSSAETRVDRGVLKQLATGEPVVVQRKNEKPYKMWNKSKLWFMANVLPDLGGIDGGLIRRLHVIHLTHVFSVDDAIQDILFTTRAIQWFTYKCLSSYVEFLAFNSRFSDSEDMITERKYYTLTNNVYDFLYNVYSSDRTELLGMIRGRSSTALYDEYKTYCIDNGMKPLQSTKFKTKLKTDFNIGTRKENVMNDLGKASSMMVFDEIGTRGAK